VKSLPSNVECLECELTDLGAGDLGTGEGGPGEAVVLAKARTHTAESIGFGPLAADLRQTKACGYGSWLSPGRPGF